METSDLPQPNNGKVKHTGERRKLLRKLSIVFVILEFLAILFMLVLLFDAIKSETYISGTSYFFDILKIKPELWLLLYYCTFPVIGLTVLIIALSFGSTGIVKEKNRRDIRLLVFSIASVFLCGSCYFLMAIGIWGM